jgi:hypothetical protein
MNIIVKMSSTQLKILAGAMIDRKKYANPPLNELGNKLCEDLIYHSEMVNNQIDLTEAESMSKITQAKFYPASELRVGDFVFSNKGRPCEITKIEGDMFTFDSCDPTQVAKDTFAYKSKCESKDFDVHTGQCHRCGELMGNSRHTDKVDQLDDLGTGPFR